MISHSLSKFHQTSSFVNLNFQKIKRANKPVDEKNVVFPFFWCDKRLKIRYLTSSSLHEPQKNYGQHDYEKRAGEQDLLGVERRSYSSGRPEVVQKAVELITSALGSGNRVVLRNFGTFAVKEVKAKVGRNPKDPAKDVPIPARKVVKFKVGKTLKEAAAKSKI